MDVRFQSNIREVERGLSDFAKRQLPFAVSLALNDTAADVAKNAEKGLAKRLDRPTPFTRRAFAVLRSSRARLAAAVFAKDAQAAYLRFQEEGGERRPKGRAIVVPVNVRLNKFGNNRPAVVTDFYVGGIKSAINPLPRLIRLILGF
jgi:hypothetical protein